MSLPKAYNPKDVEEKIYGLWQKSGFFNPDKLPGPRKKSYTVVIPPPNVTGELHMGHALNAVIQDILIRKKRMEGFRTLWLPGTDHAGIATQNVVEKMLRKEGQSRFDLGREKFIEKVWQWREKYGNIILEQFKKIGASCDWSRTRFTMDKDYIKAVEFAFLHYHKKGWIYQGEKVVNWCPRCQTSLSDLELEYKEEKGRLYYIKYPISNSEFFKKTEGANFIIVATTRPETMLGDTAVAVNPKDKRYKNLIGKTVILPIQNKKIPVIADRAIDQKFGTGAVKITPAHDLTDWEIKERHNLESIKIIAEDGKMTEKSKICQGLTSFQCREKVVQILEKENLIEKIEDYGHSLPCCYRCHSLIEPIASKQWFLKMNALAQIAIKKVKTGKVKFVPKNFEKIYFDWLKNIKDWCISRQIWWGHKLPVWQCQTARISNSQLPTSKQFKNSKLKIKNSPEEYFIISAKKPEACPFCDKCSMKQSEDVLDTWFSSALWPFAALGFPEKTKDLKIFYPTNVLSTARDIINLWVARMIFSGVEFTKRAPFHTVYIHPTVLTKEGKRMSKSLGTGIDPISLIEKYGADATRFGVSWQLTGGQDIKFTEDNMVMGKKFCNKIWNAARFVMLQAADSPNKSLRISTKQTKSKNGKLTPDDKKILNALNKTVKSMERNIDNFKFGKATHAIYDFFWHDFCDTYIEKSKLQKDKKNTQKILLYVLLTSLKLLHPCIPSITEEIYQKLPIKNKKKCLMIEEWPR